MLTLALPDWFVPVVYPELWLTGLKNKWRLALDCRQFLDHYGSSWQEEGQDGDDAPNDDDAPVPTG